MAQESRALAALPGMQIQLPVATWQLTAIGKFRFRGADTSAATNHTWSIDIHAGKITICIK